MHTDTVSTSVTTVHTIADLERDLDEHLIALPAGDPAEGPTERACEVVSLLARYAGYLPAFVVGDVADCLSAALPISGALYRAPIVRRFRSGTDDPALAVVALHTQLLIALGAAERMDVDYECQAHHDVVTLRAWLAEVALAMPARTIIADGLTREQAERALRAAVTPFGSLDADMAPMILAAGDRSAGALDALDEALANVDGERSELAIIPHPRSGVGAWGTGVVTPTSGTLILVARTRGGDYRVSVDFRPHPLDGGALAQHRPMQIRCADEGVVWSAIGAS